MTSPAQPRSRPPIGWLAVVLVALCVFVVSVPKTGMILGGDSPWPELDPGVAIGQRATLWADYAGFGKDNSFNRALLPMAYVDKGLRSIGATPVGLNRLWLFLVLAAQAIGATRVLLLFFPRAAEKPVVMGFVATASLLNPYILLNFHTPYPALDLGIACGPGIFASVAAFVRTGRTAYACEALAWVCLASPANANPAYIMEHVGLVGLAIVTGAAFGGWHVLIAASRAAVVALGYLAVNLFFWIPMAAYAFSAFAHLANDGSRYTADTVTVTAQFSALGDVMRLVGGYLFFNPVGPAPYIPEHAAFSDNPLVVMATLALPLLAAACIALYWRRPERNSVFALTLAAVTLVLLSKGAAAPGGEAFRWLVSHAPWFAAFRDSFGKFVWVLLFVYTTLAGGALLKLNYALKERASLVNSICFIFVLISGFPIAAGHLFWTNAVVRIPQQYASLATAVRHLPPDARLLEMPVQPTIFDAYTWGFVGAGLTTNLIGQSLVSREFDFGEPENADVTAAASDFEHSFGQRRLLFLLGLLGVDHIIRDANADTSFYLSSPANSVRANAETTRAFSSNGLDLLRLHPDIVNARIYAADRIVLGAASPEDVALACGILNGCKGVAFVSDDVAVSWPAARASSARIESLGPAAQKNAASSAGHLFTLPMPAFIRGYPTPHARVAFVDFADASQSGTFARSDGQWYEGYPPIDVALSGPNATFSPVYELARFPEQQGTSRTLCARDGQTITTALEASHPGLQSSVTLLALQYSADAEGAWIAASSRTPSGNAPGFYMMLPPGKEHVALRLVRPASDDVSLVVGITAAAGDANCIRVSRLTLATAKDSVRWSLSGNSRDMYVTPPYMAAYSNIVADAASRGMQEANGISARQFARSDFRGNVRTGIWSAAETLSGIGTVAVDPVNGTGSSPMTLRAAERTAADSHMQIEHLTPGATYKFAVPVVRWSGTPPRVAILSQTGDVLYDTTLSQSQRSASLSGYVTNPADSSKLFAYVYTGSTSASASALTVGPTSVSLSKALAAVTWQSGKKLAVPASLRYSQVDSSNYRVQVSGAPASYLLVLNNAYNAAWQVAAPAGVSVEHVSANLGENAWLVRGAGNYTLTIAYTNDRFRAYAAGASAICAIAAIILFLMLRIRRGRLEPHDVSG